MGWKISCAVLGGSWLIIAGVTSKVTIVISITKIGGLIIPVMSTREPSSNAFTRSRLTMAVVGYRGIGLSCFFPKLATANP